MAKFLLFDLLKAVNFMLDKNKIRKFGFTSDNIVSIIVIRLMIVYLTIN